MSQASASDQTTANRGFFGPALEHWRGRESVADLVRALGDLGYPMTAEQYEQAEAGVSRPTPLAGFIGAVATHHGLGSTASGDLSRRAAFDIMYEKLGDCILDLHVLSEPPAEYPPAQDGDPDPMPPLPGDLE